MGYGKNLNYRMPNKAVEATPNGPPHFYVGPKSYTHDAPS